MKILTVSTLATGGAAVAAQNLHAALCNEGHDGLFVTLFPPDGLPHSASIGYGGGTSPHWMAELFAYWASLSFPEKMKEQCCDLFSDTTSVFYDFVPERLFADADIIHVHWGAGFVYSPFLFKCFEGKKIIFTLHDFNPFTGGCHYAKYCDRYMRECGNCPVLLESSPFDLSSAVFAVKRDLYASLKPAIIAPSRWLLELAGKSPLLSSRPGRHIPNAHPLDFYKPLDRDALRNKHGLAPDNFVLLCGAEYLQNPRKGGEFFKKLVALIQAQTDVSEIAVITFGSGRFDLAGIRHMGMVAKEELRDLYNIADVFVHPALLDNLSNTLCEAQCCGTPVIAFDTGGNAEAFAAGKSGVLVAEQTAEALLDAVRQIYHANNDARASMRLAARRYAEETFSPDTVARSHVAFYMELLTSPETASSDAELQNRLLLQNIVGLSKFIGSVFTHRECLQGEITRIQEETAGLRGELAGLRGELAKVTYSMATLSPVVNSIRKITKLFRQTK